MAAPGSPTPATTPDLSQAQAAVTNLSDTVIKVGGNIGQLPGLIVDAFSGTAEAIAPVLRNLDKLSTESATARFALFGVSTAYNQFKDSLTKDNAGFMTLSDQFAALEKQAKGLSDTAAASLLKTVFSSSEQAEAADNAAKKAATMGKSYIGTLTEMAKAVVAASDQHAILREKMLTVAAQSGSMNQLKGLTSDFTSLEEYVSYTDKALTDIGGTLGITKDRMVEYYGEFSKIPGVFQLTYDSMRSGKVGSDMFMQGMLEVNKALKIPISELTGNIQKLRDELNLPTTGEGAKDAGNKIIETFTTISKSAEELGVSTSKLTGTIFTVSNNFKYFGDNTVGVTRSIYEMAKGFKEVGISAANASELAGNFVGRLKDLTIGQKAFFSELTGGPGGAMGAAKIDLLLKEGKTEEVMKMARQAIKSQLGEIVTTEEAATSQEAAGRRLLQIKQLQALGLGGQGEREAGVQLDLLKQQEAVGQQLKSSKDIANEFLARGEKVTERENTPVKQILAKVEEMRTDTYRTANNTTQLLLGGKAPTRMGDVFTPDALTQGGKVDPFSEMRRAYSEMKEASMQAARNTGTMIRGGAVEFGPRPEPLTTQGSIVTDALDKTLKQHLATKFKLSTGAETDKMLADLKSFEQASEGKDAKAEEKARFMLAFQYLKQESKSPKTDEDMKKYVSEHLKDEAKKLAATSTADTTAKGAAPSGGSVAGRPVGGGDSAGLVMPVNSGVICAACHKELHEIYVRIKDMGKAVPGQTPTRK